MANRALPLVFASTLVCCLSLCSSAAVAAGPSADSAAAPPQSSAQLQRGDENTGQDLFSGRRRFAAGGPPCAACHDIGALPFPRGGTLGPDLTGAYTKYGPEGLANVLSTLFFPTMAPIFDQRPLTPEEQRELATFFKQAAGKQAQPTLSGRLVLLAIVTLILLLVLAWLWQKRSCPPPSHASLLSMRRTGGVR